jgi:hypothetical protein
MTHSFNYAFMGGNGRLHNKMEAGFVRLWIFLFWLNERNEVLDYRDGTR